MTKSRHRKNHKEKVNARKVRIESEKSRQRKAQKEWIMNLIKEEEKKGLFNNTKAIDGQSPVIDGPVIDGPQI